MWSPSFVPKCRDWHSYVDVVGEFRSMGGAVSAVHLYSVLVSDSSLMWCACVFIIQPSTFKPPQALVDFLAAGSKPIYIGFGSMVIEDSSRLVDMIKEASTAVGCRVVLQSGWTKYAEELTLLTDKVMVIGAMPHDWLLYQVWAVNAVTR